MYRNQRWWATSSGNAIVVAESNAYSSFAGDQRSLRQVAQGPGSSDISTVRQVIEEGGFVRFLNELQHAAGASQRCLLPVVSLAEGCDAAQLASTGVASTTEPGNIVDLATRTAYARVSPGDLSAYLAYLRTGDAGKVIAALRSSLVEVEKIHTDRALDEVTRTIQDYVRTRVGDPKEALRKITTAVDRGVDLEQSRIALQLLRLADQHDPTILVELARITLMQAPSVSNGLPGMPPQLSPETRSAAQGWLDQAHKLDPRRTDTLVLEGHLAYLNGEYDRSIQLLEQAREIGTTNPWLRIDLGNAYFARGLSGRGDKTTVQRAATEFEAALAHDIPVAARGAALHQLCDVYDYLGDVHKADQYHRQFIATLHGEAKGSALHRYAMFLLLSAHDVDKSLTAVQSAVELGDSDAEDFMVEVLLVKSGELYSVGQSKQALKLVEAARQSQPDLVSGCSTMASLKATYPGIQALHASGVLKDFSGEDGSRALVLATQWANSQQIEELLAWGADPNHLDSDFGTALQSAILWNNLAAVKVLLAHGADPLIRYSDGRMPSQLSGDPSDIRQREIQALVEKAAAQRSPAGAAVGGPFRQGYTYRLKRSINGDPWGNSFSAGESLVYFGQCSYTDSHIACFSFSRPATPNNPLDLAIKKDDLPRWNEWFEEVGRAK